MFSMPNSLSVQENTGRFGGEEDFEKLQTGYRMLDDIEKRLKGYLDRGSENRVPEAGDFNFLR